VRGGSTLREKFGYTPTELDPGAGGAFGAGQQASVVSRLVGQASSGGVLDTEE
jgi:hypothetical protein